MAEQTITKICRVCKEIKPLSEFYKRADSPDGYRNNCKVCVLKESKEYGKTEKGKAVHRSAYLRFISTEKGKASCRKANLRYQKSKKGKAYYNHRAKHYAKLHPERSKAIHAVNYAVTKGKLPRPDSLQCHYCPARANQYHHWHGYDPEHRLDVIPVCGKCHYILPRS